MLGIGEEVSVFLQAFFAGNIVFFVYNCIRVIRRLIKHNLFFVSVEDFFFWFGAALYLFIELYHTSDGSIRWFFVAGVVVGVCGACKLVKLARKLYRAAAKKGEKSIDKSRKTR